MSAIGWIMWEGSEFLASHVHVLIQGVELVEGGRKCFVNDGGR